MSVRFELIEIEGKRSKYVVLKFDPDYSIPMNEIGEFVKYADSERAWPRRDSDGNLELVAETSQWSP